MRRLLYPLLGLVLLASNRAVPMHAQAPADTTVYAVSYVEVMPSAGAAMVTALKQYRDASRKENGYIRVDLLEQSARPGHFAVVEAWTDQKAFDAHGTSPQAQQLRDALQSIRLSGYDQRPYKTLTVTPARGAGNGQAVHVVAHVDTIPAGGADGPGLLRRFAEASRAEQGCLRFDVLQSAQRANHFTVVESWQNQRARDAHAAAAHTKQFRDTVQPMTGSPMDERVYKAIE